MSTNGIDRHNILYGMFVAHYLSDYLIRQTLFNNCLLQITQSIFVNQNLCKSETEIIALINLIVVTQGLVLCLFA